MIYYVTCNELKEAVKATRLLQMNDYDNMYISPLEAFAHLAPEDANILTLRLDLLTVCDKLIVAHKPTGIMLDEIDLAKRIGMEVEYL